MPFCVALLVVTSFVTAPAQAGRPDFSGKWTLDVQKSDFGGPGQQQPTARVDEITQTASVIKVRRVITLPDGPRTLDITYDLSGKETTQQVPPLKLKASWKGKDVVTVGKGQAQDGAEMTITDTWQLGADRKTLTIHREVVVPAGTVKQVFVLKRT